MTLRGCDLVSIANEQLGLRGLDGIHVAFFAQVARDPPLRTNFIQISEHRFTLDPCHL